MAHLDPGQIQCIEALQETHGPSSPRLLALAFWGSPAALSQELPARVPVPTCTLSTLLPEGLTSLPREGAQLSCPRPQPGTDGFGTCFIYNSSSLDADPPLGQGASRSHPSLLEHVHSLSLPASIPHDLLHIYTLPGVVAGAWHAESKERRETPKPAVPTELPASQEKPACSFLSPLGQGLFFLAPGSQCASSVWGKWQGCCSPTPREGGTC